MGKLSNLIIINQLTITMSLNTTGLGYFPQHSDHHYLDKEKVETFTEKMLYPNMVIKTRGQGQRTQWERTCSHHVTRAVFQQMNI